MFHVLSFQKNFNRALKSSVFFVFFLGTFMSISDAASVSNFGQWRNLSSQSKTAYTAGAIDSFINPLEMSLGYEEFAENFALCLKTLSISTLEIAQMIDNFYLNPGNWGLSPQEAIRFQLANGHCFHFLN